MAEPEIEQTFGDPPRNEAPAVRERRRLLNRWSLFALLVVSAIGTVLYVGNVLAVNTLLRDTATVQRNLDSVRAVNQSLQAETYRLQSAERVTRVATERLGMIPPPKAPTVLLGDPRETQP